MSKVNKLYLDTRYAVEKSYNGGVCTFEFDEIETTPETRLWIAEFTCVAAWPTFYSGNSTFYLEEDGGASTRSTQLSGTYDIDGLADALESWLNGVTKDPAMGTYTVSKVGSTLSGVSYVYLRVECDSGFFRIPSDARIKMVFSTTTPNSTNTLFSFPSGDALLGTHTSSFIDLRRAHNVYLHMPSLGSYASIAPNGSRTCVCKIPVTAPFGDLVVWQSSGLHHDSAPAGVRSLNRLTLELRDAHGNELPVIGTHWSCTIIFER